MQELLEQRNRSKLGVPVKTQTPNMTVAELVTAFLKWASKNYVKYGKPTGAFHSYEQASRPLINHYGKMRVADFAVLDLENIKRLLAESGLCRNTANTRLGQIKTIFNWGAKQGIIPVEIAARLKFVTGILKGRTSAPETPESPFRVRSGHQRRSLIPVACPCRYAANVEIHRNPPGELFQMTWREINTTQKSGSIHRKITKPISKKLKDLSCSPKNVRKFLKKKSIKICRTTKLSFPQNEINWKKPAAKNEHAENP
jgi:hypothetical protein